MAGLERTGWQRFGFDPELLEWVRATVPEARRAVDAAENAHWLRCDGTWFAGVNVLPNKADGSIAAGVPLTGLAVAQARALNGADLTWDRAQVSVVYPGYPRQQGESDAAFRFRQYHDAAHVDGLTRHGKPPRRFLTEPHAFVLGVPLVETDAGASPMVVWQGSHLVMRDAFRAALQDIDPAKWSQIDLTDVYQAARRRCFDTCERRVVHAQPGEAYLIHRLALHGVSPWQAGAMAPPEGRMIAYFRPLLLQVGDWLNAG